MPLVEQGLEQVGKAANAHPEKLLLSSSTLEAFLPFLSHVGKWKRQKSEASLKKSRRKGSQCLAVSLAYLMGKWVSDLLDITVFNLDLSLVN